MRYRVHRILYWIMGDKQASRWRCSLNCNSVPQYGEVDNVRVIRAANPVCRRTTERSKILNPEYNIFRDQPTPRASPLRINTLLHGETCHYFRGSIKCSGYTITCFGYDGINHYLYCANSRSASWACRLPSLNLDFRPDRERRSIAVHKPSKVGAFAAPSLK